MEKIIKKRTDLLNFFLNEDRQYTKEEILQKEFAVLSFSPREEYIDLIKSDYDHLCVDLDTFTFEDTDECYVKGIIVDVDRQKEQTIIHIINKDNNVGIVVKPFVSQHYDKYLVVGEPVICKCKIWRERLYMSFLVLLNDMDEFVQEIKYMSGISCKIVKDEMSNIDEFDLHLGVIVECNLVKTKSKRDMIRGTMFDGKQYRQFGTMNNEYSSLDIPRQLKAGDFVQFKKPTHEFFINDMEIVVI